MTEEMIKETKKEECKCFCKSEGFRNFIVVATGTFVGVFCAISLFAALHKPPKFIPMPPRMMQPPAIHHVQGCPLQDMHRHHHGIKPHHKFGGHQLHKNFEGKRAHHDFQGKKHHPKFDRKKYEGKNLEGKKFEGKKFDKEKIEKFKQRKALEKKLENKTTNQ